MKVSLVILLLLVTVLVVWFWPKHEPALHWVVLTEQQGMLTHRDRAILHTIEQDWARGLARDQVRITYVDSALPQPLLENTLDRIEQTQPIDMLLGCGDSVCLRNVIPWLRHNERFLLYPASSEGLLASDWVVHVGLMGNQLLLPVVHWLQAQPIRDVLMVGSNSARSTMLFRMLEAHERWQQQQMTFTTLLFDYAEQFDELGEQVLERLPDVLILDVCEWIDQPQRQRALSALPIPMVSLCADQPIDLMSGVLVVQQVDAEMNPSVLNLSSPLARNMHWLNQQLQQAVEQGLVHDAGALRTFWGLRSGWQSTGTITVDRDLRGTWQSVALVLQQSERTERVWQSSHAIRPQEFPSSNSPSTWLHDLTIYWRNAGGFWRTARVEEL